MAIIACSECAHDVSNQAATCPNCGAPIAAPPPTPKRRTKRGILGIIITLAVLCLLAGTLWYLPPNQLGGLLGQFGRKAEHPVAAGPSSAAIHPAIAERTARESDVGPRPVYKITAEQLFQAYRANAVATQSRIGNSAIRITGTVVEIDEDATGRAVVRLLTSHDDSAEMMLNDDQKTAAAELFKGEVVDVQCERIQRDSTQRTIATPQGSGCALVSVDAGSTQAYLAVFLPNEKGVAPIYIVGPMTKAACLSRGDSISAQLGEVRRDPVISKNCAATAQESIPSEGCRLSASMTALPDMPTAHLWRYECAERPAAPRRATDSATAQKKSLRSSAVANVATVTVAEPPAKAEDFALSEATTVAAPARTPAPPEAALPDTTQPVANAQPLTATNAQPLTATNAQPVTAPAILTAPTTLTAPATTTVTEKTPSSAAADVSNVATAPAPAPAPTPAANADVVAAPAIPADLVTVKAADPSAADRIADYCNKATASASDQAAVAAGCRHEEVAAWTRLVVNNEFPTLDEGSRRKCSESPFPDSYVAKESCAKYVLNINR